MRSFATIKNSAWGIAQQMIVCVLSIFSRRVMIETIGQQGVGLNALLTSVISLLSLAELGIGTAIVYHMYGPIAKGDKPRLAKLLHCYKMVYRAIAAVILLLGLCLLPFMDRIVKDVTYSRAYVSFIFLLFLIQTTSSYLFTYKRSMLSADQKQYVIIAFDLLYKIVTIVGGIVVLKLTGELAYYLMLLIVCTVVNNLLISRHVDRLYPFLKDNKGRLSIQEMRVVFRDVRHIFVGKLSEVITTSTDSILINAFVGTIQTGLFSNYNIVLNTLVSITKQFSGGMRGSVGNLIAMERPEHVGKVLSRLLFILFFIASFCAGCLTGLIDRFITLAFGPGLLLGRVSVIVLIFNLYMRTLEIPIANMIAAAGLFQYDKWISIVGAAVNLAISFVFGRMFGMAGILFGTAATYVIAFFLKSVVFYVKYLKRNVMGMLLKTAGLTLVAAVECVLVAWICSQVDVGNAYLSFLLCGCVSAAVPIALNCALFFWTDEFQYAYSVAKTALKTVAARVKRK